MQVEQAIELRKAWGDRPCDHPTFAKELIGANETGNRVCTTCGRSFSRVDANALVADRINRPGNGDAR